MVIAWFTFRKFNRYFLGRIHFWDSIEHKCIY